MGLNVKRGVTYTLKDFFGCTVLWVPESREFDWARRLAGKSAITSSLHLRPEVLRSLRYYLWAHSQGHHTINCLGERGVKRVSTWQSFLKGPSSIRPTSKPFQRQNRKLLRWSGVHMAFPEHIDTIWNWTEWVMESGTGCRQHWHVFQLTHVACTASSVSSRKRWVLVSPEEQDQRG